MIYIIDKRLGIILEHYINVEVERLTTNIVNQTIGERVIIDGYDEFLNIKRDNSEIENISYNTRNINKLTDSISKYVQDVLIRLDDGDIEKFHISDRIKSGRFKNIKKGILCDISLGSVKNSILFGNIGPTIPIKLVFLGQVNSDIDIKVKEYGFNNIMVEIYLVVKVREQVSMPLTSKQKDIIVRYPISIDIIKGKIPEYYNGFIK